MGVTGNVENGEGGKWGKRKDYIVEWEILGKYKQAIPEQRAKPLHLHRASPAHNKRVRR